MPYAALTTGWSALILFSISLGRNQQTVVTNEIFFKIKLNEQAQLELIAAPSPTFSLN